MMKKLFTLPVLSIFAAFALMLASCEREDLPIPEVFEGVKPIADFEFTPPTLEDPFTVTFTNKSSGYKDLQWSFGDDSVSYATSSTLTHLYTRNGILKVVLTATGEDGTKAVKEIELPIEPPISFTTTPEGDALRFTNTSQFQGKSIAWDFGDGTKSTEANPLHKYADPTALQTPKISITTEKGSVGTVQYILKDNIPYKNVTLKYLKNTIRPFKTVARNTSQPQVGSWGILASGTTNAAVKQRTDGLGGFDRDTEGGNNMSMEAWGNSEPKIYNGKIFQSPNLPAGDYIFQVIQPNQEMQDAQDKAFAVAAKGEDLPNIENRTESLGVVKLNHPDDGPVIVSFKVEQAGIVSMGILATLDIRDQYIRVKEVKLFKAD